MKVHYINILLFSLPLNILEHNPWNHYMKPHTYTNRSLCECDLYIPNYDNDAQMKEVMENFNKQTQQRFHEYDERMKTTRQKCKDQFDKEIQKIILKDKLEKQMAQQLTTLETKIDTNDIPTCVCEKSVADKVEKNCMKCTQNLGGIVAPSSGVLLGIAEGALYAWKPVALEAAIAAAKEAGMAAGIKAGEAAGAAKVIAQVESQFHVSAAFGKELGSVINGTNYNNTEYIFKAIFSKFNESCLGGGTRLSGFTAAPTDQAFCRTVDTLVFAPGNVRVQTSIRELFSHSQLSTLVR
ncbi:hypothetical protein PFTANZ_01663 [Plasmodium falciparum Tanzania (2000708)]|uniref:Surface antigen n=1 Tax=Plasmodium falciparum Tanzania (2000708) TaxID=1036725 RepID=A0A024WB79_PLAFA|nr:hypothetical protein PFTANZ_01663 [Plasmodium falciparum Tanzania (2000708)]